MPLGRGPGGLDSSNAATAYNNLVLHTGASSRGPMPIRTFRGLSTQMGGMGLCAPGWFQDSQGQGPDSYDYDGGVLGCSFATPATAGAAALMRNALNVLGWPGNDARILMTMMLLQGDGWNGSNPGGELTSGISSTRHRHQRLGHLSARRWRAGVAGGPVRR
jgi:subtilisin family serine protease